MTMAGITPEWGNIAVTAWLVCWAIGLVYAVGWWVGSKTKTEDDDDQRHSSRSRFKRNPRRRNNRLGNKSKTMGDRLAQKKNSQRLGSRRHRGRSR